MPEALSEWGFDARGKAAVREPERVVIVLLVQEAHAYPTLDAFARFETHEWVRVIDFVIPTFGAAKERLRRTVFGCVIA